MNLKASRVATLGAFWFKSPLVLDGAAGTLLGARPGMCADLLCLTEPERVAAMHRAYLEADSDIIETNTFNANAMSLNRFGAASRVHELNIKAAAIARAEADKAMQRQPGKPRFVAGAIGPTEAMLSRPGCAVSAASLTDIFTEQATALMEGDVDLLLIESVYDLESGVAAMRGVMQARAATGSQTPFTLSAVPAGSGGALPSGHTLPQLVEVAKPFNPLALGLNCCDSATLCRYARELKEHSPFPLLLYPNAGIPAADGTYPDAPEAWIRPMLPLLEKGTPAIAGGCCGTTPDYIRALATSLSQKEQK